MSRSHRAVTGAAGLPRELADRFTKPFTRFLHFESLGGGLLLLAAVAAIATSNSVAAEAYAGWWEIPVGVRVGALDFTRTVREWINDGLMTLFFFVVSLELKRELVLGEMRSARNAMFSIAAAIGGMVAPAAIYLALMVGEAGVHGWGTVMATDTAFVIGGLALLGRRIPQNLRLFMLSLAIVDDIGAIVVVAIGYSDRIAWSALACAAVGLGGVRGMALVGIRSVPIYILVGVACWVAFDASGLHPTITGVCLGLLTPTRAWVSKARLQRILDRIAPAPSGDLRIDDAELRATWRRTGTAVRETLSPVERLEAALHPWVSIAVMPLFALANAGVAVSAAAFESPIAVATLVGLAIGKPLGVTCAAWLSVRVGVATWPTGMSGAMLVGCGCLAGIGFTMSLFIAEVAFPAGSLDAAKLGILGASLVSGSIGLAILAWVGRGRGA